MSDRPETLWAENCNGNWATDDDEYRRADLPPTLSAAMELPEVRAMVELVKRASAIIDPCYPEKHHAWQKDATAALTQLKEPKT